jgi:uncharacterized protein YbcI
LTDIQQDRQTGGSLAAAISNATVRIMSEYTGRGPTKARTSIRDDVILVLMHDTLTKAERSLAAAGDGEFVMQTRERFQRTMRDDLIAAIEMLTERKVLAFMSSNHLGPDMAAEMFVMEPSADSSPAAG